MKSRIDFVTNSSSSSYIIASNKTSNHHVNTLLDNILNSVRNTKISTVAELNYYIERKYGYGSYDTVEKIIEDDDYVKERYEKMLKAINEDGDIYCYELDYEEEIFSNVFKAIEKSELGKVIEEGY